MVTSDPHHDPEQGSSCDAARFPHKCTIGLTEEALKNRKHPVFIKVALEDGTLMSGELTVPQPPLLSRPEILEPATTPAQETPLKIKFKDVGAEGYDVEARFCHPYRGGGINPCLEGAIYFLERREGKLVVPQNYPTFPPRISLKDDRVTVSSDLPVRFESALELSILAGQVTRGPQNVRLVTRRSVSLTLSR